MRYGIVGGDMRFAHLTRMLQEEGRMAAGFFHEKAGGGCYLPEGLRRCDCIISNYPMRFPLSEQKLTEEKIMDNILPGTVMLLCGPKFPVEKRWDLQYVNLWADEQLLQENAYLTAEGAVAAVLSRLSGTIRGRNCLIIGYGRIGRALTEILTALEAKVAVATGSKGKMDRIRQSGADAVHMANLPEMLGDMQVIFSTPPSMVLNRSLLKKVDPDALIVDLASPPYGVDMDAAEEMRIHAWREPNLPGRYCPLSAARVLFNAVNRWEERENAEN